MKHFTLTAFLLLAIISYLQAQSPVLHLQYNEANGTNITYDEISGQNFSVSNQFNKPERVTGIEDMAFRTDGHSSWVNGSLSYDFAQTMTIQTWVIAECWSADMEVGGGFTPSAIISQYEGDNGWSIKLDAFGKWFFEVNMAGQKYTCTAPEEFPLYEWVLVAGIVDANAGQMHLFLNNKIVASTPIPVGSTVTEASNATMYVGRDNFLFQPNGDQAAYNAMNASYDETKIYAVARSAADLTNEYNSATLPKWEKSLEVTDLRFDHDLQRPIYHALPPANWTNEPHGLSKSNGKYHMYYQRTPNGPFKTLMTWGHMVSTDLVNWTNTKDALRPEYYDHSYDMKGIWSGDAWVEGNTAYAFYTCVNHSGSFNPGIAMAKSTDADFQEWEKMGPIISKDHVDDFRDPYIWKTGNTYYMIIGARVNGQGGLDYYKSTDLLNWQHMNKNFTSVPYSQMDIGSDIWEMPVFEPIGNGKYVLVVSPIGGSVTKFGPEKYTRSTYWIGTFENEQFIPDFIKPKFLDIIHGHLSPTLARDENNEIVAIGIVDERTGTQAQTDAGWCHLYSLARNWYLMPDNATLGQKPVDALVNQRKAGTMKSAGNLHVSSSAILNDMQCNIHELTLNIDTNNTGSQYGVNFRRSPDGNEYISLYYDVTAQKFYLDKTNSSNGWRYDDEASLLEGDYDEAVFGKPQKIQIFMDNSVVDVFVNDAAAFSFRAYPQNAESKGVELISNGGTTIFTSVASYEMHEMTPQSLASISLSDNGDIVENTEDGKSIFIHARNCTFNSTLLTDAFAMTNQPAGITIGQVNYVDAETAEIVLSGNTLEDYDNLIENVSVTVGASQFATNVTNAMTGTGTTFIGIKEPETKLCLIQDQQIIEHDEAGKQILVRVSNNTYTTINAAYWTIDNLQGLEYDLSLVDDSTVAVTLTGQSTDYAVDITDVTVTVNVNQFTNEDPQLHGAPQLSVNEGVVLTAINGSISYGFETGDLSWWTVLAGQAFVDRNVTSETSWHGGTMSFCGNYHFWGWNEVEGDEPTGEMRTGDFTLGGTGIVSAAIAGGNNNENIYLALYRTSDDTEIGRITGVNSESYVTKTIDGSAFIGELCYLKAVDNYSGGWGHINLDCIEVPVPDHLNGQKPEPPVIELTGVELSPCPLNMYIGQPTEFTVLPVPSNATITSVEWMVDNPNIVTIDNGVVTAHQEGTALITVVVNGEFTATCNVNVLPTPSELVYDFETGDLSRWIVEGDAFSDGDVVSTTHFWGTEPFNHGGNYHLWGWYEGGDDQIGSIRTQNFVLGGNGLISFRIGGGNDINNLYLGLYSANGTLLDKVTADDSEEYTVKTIDAAAHIGTECYVKLVDNATGGWGHLNLDDLVIPTGQITNIPVTGVTLNKAETTLLVNETEQLLETVLPLDATNKAVEWNSLNNAVATVTNGLVTAVAPGTTSITVTTLDGSYTASCAVEVQSNVVSVTGVTLDKSEITLTPTDTDILTETVFPLNATNKDVEWISSNNAIATVNNGEVTAIAEGIATITVRTLDGSYTADCIVNVEITNPVGDFLVYDFESGDLSGWTTVSGNAFTDGDVCTDLTYWNGARQFNPQGSYHLWSVKEGSDDDVGEIKTQNFTLGGNGIITFMIGGGQDLANLYIALVRASDGYEIARETADNNDSEDYIAKQFSAASYIGTECYVRLVDNATGGWGHINLDNLVIPTGEPVQSDYLVYDFECGDLTGWTQTGDAFISGDVCTDLTYWDGARQFNPQGTYHLWGVKEGVDNQTGELKSEDFVIGGDGQISFMIGGGADLSNLYFALYSVAGDVEIARATGDNNDSEDYVEKTFDAASYIGTECYLKIVDNATGGWGHINMDNIRIPIQAQSVKASENDMKTSFDDMDKMLQLTVYPNPSKGQVNIQFLESINDCSIEIYNTNGKLIKQLEMESIHSPGTIKQFKLQKSGLYILKVISGNEIKSVKKVIVE